MPARVLAKTVLEEVLCRKYCAMKMARGSLEEEGDRFGNH
jgi:hypothetical protein